MRLFILMLLAALPAQAETSQLLADLNGNGLAETFVLTVSETEGVTLSISGDGKAINADEFVIHFLTSVTSPHLELAPNGSLWVHYGNDGIGRTRWDARLTIAYRDKAYRVVGYTYSWYDIIDRPDFGTCDVNLLTGKGVLQKGYAAGKSFQTSAKALTVTEWDPFENSPRECVGG